MEQINWGIIGCGDVTEFKSGPAFNLVAGSKLQAVMRRDAGKAADYAKRHDVPKWYSNASELINDSEVNMVYVATPPDTHAAYAIEALNAGKPVYVEKPMARTPEECEDMIEAAKRNKLPLFVAYYRRTLPGFVRIKTLIENGAIGKPYMVNIKLFKNALPEENQSLPWRVIPEIAGAGYFYDLASHQFDYLDFLFGPVMQVNGIARNSAQRYEAEDTVAAVFSFANGVTGTGSWCFSTPANNEVDLIEIVGEEGSIGFSCFDFVPAMLNNKEGMQQIPFEKPDHVQLNLIEKVVQEIQGKGKSPSTGETASRTNYVLHEITKSYYKK